jgi:hypothetical protein
MMELGGISPAYPLISQGLAPLYGPPGPVPMQSQPQIPNVEEALSQALTQYPRLKRLGLKAILGQPRPDRHLEFYPPWEEDNPQSGTPLLELYNHSLSGQALSDMFAADSLHYLGAIDPRTKTPVDPTWRKFKEQFGSLLSRDQHAMNQRAYLESGEKRSYGDWMEHSRLDAFLRGVLFNQWPEHIFTPEQKELAKRMRQYLQQAE